MEGQKTTSYFSLFEKLSLLLYRTVLRQNVPRITPPYRCTLVRRTYKSFYICYLSSHAPHTWDSYGARLRSDNIGFSPPPGTPPAAIASMTEVSLFPHTCHCRHRLLSGFRCLSSIARFLTEGPGAPASTARGAGFSHMSDIQFSRFDQESLLKPSTFEATRKTKNGHFFETFLFL